MTKYQEFVNFMNDLENNKKDLTAKLADAQDKIELFGRELNSAKSMILAVDNKLEQLKDNLKEYPTDVGLSAEFGIWTVRKSDYAGRADTLKEALKEAKRVYEGLLLKHKDLDYGPLAEAATLEMNKLIKDLYSQLCDKVISTVKAKETYLEALSELNRLRNAGKNAVEAGIKSQSYAKINKIENSAEHFNVLLKQFAVSETDVIKA